MQKQIECIIRGRVQMVLYRDFAKRDARSLGLKGFVQNLDDGSVKVIAQGEEEVLKKFISLLQKGSFLSKVESVDVKWSELKEFFEDFKIVY